MIALGYGKFARADRIVMLEPLSDVDGRGDGARTRVWIDGVDGPVVASRTERAILDDMQEPRRAGPHSRRRPSAQDGLFDA